MGRLAHFLYKLDFWSKRKMADIRETVKEIAEQVVKGRNLDLVDIDVHASSKKPLIRVYIDKEGGVTVKDCADVSHELSVNFYVDESVPEDFTIEVSSPGIERPLTTDRDFSRNTGRMLEVLYRKEGATASLTGTLVQSGAAEIVLRTGSSEHRINRLDIVKAKQHISF
ncbi:MAG: hypothetical protein A2268_06730 [Candidatus Raymondbacteria bacterium RifOxyA12_full_50_37]|uniref:Ribosome maturation factor RimP n=1 Tax=Candidatus Raymondbacteria bacterium RIFOXYD12_FULL_49_13 TaxID=1817890 RepID=A0A1F7F013_UNCRA|nr:MAG: hypothetical protein A2350_00605 [Candidatus Raymondbacteria bacterium RifOxyB12_full_50_8]OGJ87218.1 MAG: hypothetical protein A2268_06730 [Candidatus Raymondbacteria bacterium RifOxyA12_full_50_37]OGJ88789.1 MAG: hypothetical protein A2248_08310 [Candidatus Raymondbacteria bacterium RIFOXYA2_FULL_49_16]OGJ96548.1 MAG: hypothetical protein A2453_03275 [Candidatus Raymondbacteria bacterium RIFOXYC2_FULL_50_21]OGJ99163.1 MAG: hypothetical protein A2487_10320 [Candidatus Raymondbacteria b